jgi:hypothetical protein
MVAGAIAGNISAEATTPTGNSFAEAMRGVSKRYADKLAKSGVMPDAAASNSAVHRFGLFFQKD